MRFALKKFPFWRRNDSRRNSTAVNRKTGRGHEWENLRDESFRERVKKVGQVHSLVSAKPDRNASLNSPIVRSPSN